MKRLGLVGGQKPFVSTDPPLFITSIIEQRRSRNMPELSPQVKDLISKGIEAYANSNIEEAIPLLREAIRIEPRAVDAWTTLAECHLDLGQQVECLQLRIIATHLREPDVETWRELGQNSK